MNTEITGKSIALEIEGHPMTVYNQRNALWNHYYDYVNPPKATLSNAGCGVFSICHCGQWLTGKTLSPDELADFSMRNGGRGDDGTDRPALLSAMMEKGWAERFGFRYNGDGLRNDIPVLSKHLLEGKGVALCNLRAGHIVALVKARIIDNETQYLTIDPYSETTDPRVMPIIREVISDSAIISVVRNPAGVRTGYCLQYAVYWCTNTTVRDFNLLYSI